MRESAPVIWDDQAGLWMLTRHADVRSCLRDGRLGRVYEHMNSEDISDPRWAAFFKVDRYSLLSLEPPEHTRLRRLVAKTFTVRAVESVRRPARRLADRLLEELAEHGEFDLIADFAQPYSVAIISDLLGVPFEDHQDLLDWSHKIVRMFELNTTEAQAEEAARAAAAFDSYVRGLIHFHRPEPRGGLIGELVHVDEDGEQLTDDEIVSTTILLLNAGHEAIVNTLGNGITAFMRNRDEWYRVVDGWVAPAIAVEEMVRWDAPLQLFERWVLSDDFEVAGKHLRRGEKIGMLFGSANRDPRAFDDPDTFRASRHGVHHVGFGGGTHHCLGAPLARVELDVALDALARKAPDMELTADPVRQDAFTIHGYESVPLELHG